MRVDSVDYSKTGILSLREKLIQIRERSIDLGDMVVLAHVVCLLHRMAELVED